MWRLVPGEGGDADVADNLDESPSVLSDERGCFGGPALKVESLPRLKPFVSDCRLNSSNSGFWSRGTTLGDAAAAECTFEVGGLQLARGAAPDMKPSFEASILSPK